MTTLPRILLLFLVSLLASPSQAQYERMGGVYYAYPVTHTTMAAPPQGYRPFYLSHYGRHGSRWMTSDQRYEWILSHFIDKQNLTPLGRDVRQRLKKVWKNAKGHGGQLTPLGARQHRAIAQRMYQNFPQLFAPGARLSAHSSVAGRCRASMLAFLDELGRQGCQRLPEAVTDSADMDWIAYTSPEMKTLEASIAVPLKVSPERFTAALFIDPSKVENPTKLFTEMHTVASDMQDVELPLTFFDLFTPEEIEAVYEQNNTRMTRCNGDHFLNAGVPARSAVSLWQRIAADADAAIAAGSTGADLRFGHDTNLYRLLTLMGARAEGQRVGNEDFDRMDAVLPMAANVQLIFYKNADGKVLVQLLHNERPLHLDMASAATGFYEWTELKRHLSQRIHLMEHLRQLSALNTMVGTDQANTRSAGLFGKGSEEKGQTLPAVLVPNGQTFWTPQTQPTEQKCVSPYYYKDTLFQGIRASHWLVGGCTQDYGSFTVEARRVGGVGEASVVGTPFSHDDETSHPNYYAVSLPREQLLLELTGLSHAAIMRVTPWHDGPLTITVTANSDEQEGGVELDAQRRMVYGFNPVHRIYQGWGEPAGFCGHFVMTYADSLLSFSRQGPTLTLVFQARRGHPLELLMATSFTSRQGAEANLQAEAGGKTFSQMAAQCAQRWTERLHTIDVSDSDTARVDQFYGALYRASFLPREMSDVDGAYPRFASGIPARPSSLITPHSSLRYGDFSMWDTYRALHPLYNIIVPETSAQMMQSLVGMAQEGGWMPIFPCWNSYTAAMIGDHCASVLADAYVKGIRGFDARQAYRFMRRNATQQPENFADYQNGMGRRALDSYLRHGYIPLEDSVKEAFHQQEQTSRTLEYAYDDFCVAQLARGLQQDGLQPQDADLKKDYEELMRRSENWRGVINPLTGYADGRHADGRWANNQDLVSRQPYITEGATCHYTWYVPQNIPGLIQLMGGPQRFTAKLDSMFTQGRYWHGNEPCHQVAWLYSLAGQPEKTAQRVAHILATEYNDSPGGLSGNDDAGQMSAWQLFAMMGFYPVCPGTPQYVLGGAQLQQVTLNQPGRRPFVIRRSSDNRYRLNGQPLSQGFTISHDQLLEGGELELPGAGR